MECPRILGPCMEDTPCKISLMMRLDRYDAGGYVLENTYCTILSSEFEKE
jgi:hypothetical protein